jgi:hypothetical protein
MVVVMVVKMGRLDNAIRSVSDDNDDDDDGGGGDDDDDDDDDDETCWFWRWI